MNEWIYVWDTKTPFKWAAIKGGPNGLQLFDFGLNSRRQASMSAGGTFTPPGNKPREAAIGEIAWLSGTVRALNEYFSGGNPKFHTPLDMSSHTEFRKKIWRACMKIPRGKTHAYGQLAALAGAPAAARAAGNALNANPFPVIVPCHRVIRASGRPGGFAKGSKMKIMLLDLESTN
jgi:O-6-methylguanine DNA methyltransferase